MKIPKRVNVAWDWVDDHIGPLAVLVALVSVVVAGLWLPLLAAFVLGVAAGGFVVRFQTAPRVKKLRIEVDALLRENGALRHQNTMLTSGVISSSTLLTERLPVIPDDPEDQ